MRPPKRQSPRAAGSGAKQRNGEQNATATGGVWQRDPQAGKWLAVTLYCCGARSLELTAANFARHPQWRRA